MDQAFTEPPCAFQQHAVAEDPAGDAARHVRTAGHANRRHRQVGRRQRAADRDRPTVGHAVVRVVGVPVPRGARGRLRIRLDVDVRRVGRQPDRPVLGAGRAGTGRNGGHIDTCRRRRAMTRQAVVEVVDGAIAMHAAAAVLTDRVVARVQDVQAEHHVDVVAVTAGHRAGQRLGHRCTTTRRGGRTSSERNGCCQGAEHQCQAGHRAARTTGDLTERANNPQSHTRSTFESGEAGGGRAATELCWGCHRQHSAEDDYSVRAKRIG